MNVTPRAGRFVTARVGEAFGPKLAYETRRLAWVLSAEELAPLLEDLSVRRVARHLGFTATQESALRDGEERMRLYFLPVKEPVVHCDWAAFIALVGEAYGAEIKALLAQHAVALETTQFADVQAMDPQLDMLALYSAHGDARRSDPARYIASPNRLIDARAFLFHELGLNEHADLPFTRPQSDCGAARTLACMSANISLEELEFIDVTSGGDARAELWEADELQAATRTHGVPTRAKKRKSTAPRPIRKVLTNAVTAEKKLVAVGHKTAAGEEVYVSGVQGGKQKSRAASKPKKKKPAAKKKATKKPAAKKKATKRVIEESESEPSAAEEEQPAPKRARRAKSQATASSSSASSTK